MVAPGTSARKSGQGHRDSSVQSRQMRTKKQRAQLYMRAWREKNREHLKTYRREQSRARRAKDPERVREYQRTWKRAKRSQNPELARRLARLYYAAHREVILKWWRAYRKKPRVYPRVLARQTTNNAIRYGKLTPRPCEVCGRKRVEAHHDDYSKPLKVRWLCATHHRHKHPRTVKLKRC